MYFVVSVILSKIELKWVKDNKENRKKCTAKKYDRQIIIVIKSK